VAELHRVLVALPNAGKLRRPTRGRAGIIAGAQLYVGARRNVCTSDRGAGLCRGSL